MTKGDTVLINCYGTAAFPLMIEVYALCLKRGARYVEYNISLPEMGRTFYAHASQDQLNYFPDHKLDFMKKADIFIGVAAVADYRVSAPRKHKIKKTDEAQRI